jgi:transcriptional regulator with XRE-family HTH domain
MQQVYNQYREIHNLPFPEDIKRIREKYGLPASKMSEVLGFGINSYRNYESGEVPSQSNARLIQIADDAKEFKNLVKLSQAFSEESLKKLIKKIDQIIEDEENSSFNSQFQDYLFGKNMPDEFTGYKKPCLKKLTEMVVYFTEQLEPWKTKMNKLLFYADFLNFKRTCFSISGIRYRAIDMGPVPNNFNSIFEYLANNNEIDIRITEFNDNNLGEQFKPNERRKFNPDLFDENELNILEEVKHKFSKTGTKEIIEISHKEKAWEENYNNGKKIISYKYGFEISEI